MRPRDDGEPEEVLKDEVKKLRRRARSARSRHEAFRYLERAADEIEECLEARGHSGSDRARKITGG
jgi:hypothetical protein